MKNKMFKSFSAVVIASVMAFTQVSCCIKDSEKKETSSNPVNKTVVQKDELTILNENVNKYYDTIVDAVKNRDEVLQKKSAKSMSKAIEELKIEIDKDLTQTEKSLEKYNNNVLNDRLKSYKTEVYSKIKQVEKTLDSLSKSDFNAKENLNSLSEIFEEKEDYEPTAVPTKATNTNIVNEKITSNIKYAKNNTYSEPTSDDLKFDTETTINDDIKKVADELKTARNVYEYVKNTFVYEYYAGSRKGAIATFDQLGGNDVDQASLLIGMLRYLKIPARYATGTVTITPQQAIDITGADNAENAGRLLASQHKQVSRVTKNGETVCFKMKQTWVEAYVPYTDYRGAGNNSGDKVWVSIDPSFKEMVVKEKTVDAQYSDMDLYVEKNLKKYDSNYNLDDKINVFLRQINGNIDKYIPASLPYQLISKDKVYSAIPDSEKDKISVTVGWKSLFSCTTSELYGKNITICFEGENAYDQELIKSYGGVDKVPAYLVNVVPVAKIGDKEYRGDWGVTLGTVQKMYTYITNKGGTSSLCDNITAGSVYAINLDLQIISEREAALSYERYEKAQKNATELGAYSGEFLGAALDYAGKTYFATCDASAKASSLALNINRNRQLALAFTGYKMRSESIFGYVRNLRYGSFYIDVAYNNLTAISYSGDAKDEFKFFASQGMLESSYEGSLWKTLFNDKTVGISTASVFTIASAMDMDFSIITKDNVEKELALCNVSDTTKNDVRNFVNQGLVVTLVPQDIQIESWKGTAYTAIDLKTGSGSYMLSGGIAGGSTSNNIKLTTDDKDISTFEAIDLCFQINQTLYMINMATSLKGLSDAAAGFVTGAINPTAYLSNTLPLINSAKSFAEAYVMRYENLEYYCDYMINSSDENAVNMAKYTLKNIMSFINGMYVDLLTNNASVNIGGVEIGLGDIVGLFDLPTMVTMPEAVLLDDILQLCQCVPKHNSANLIVMLCKMVGVHDGDFLPDDSD